MATKRFPLRKRLVVSMSEAAYDRLRVLNAAHGLSNNYLLTILLERLDEYADQDQLDRAFKAFRAEYGAPDPGAMARTRQEP